MANIVGVRFKAVGKVYYFDPLDFDIKEGDSVIVETARGIEYGDVVLGIREVEDDKVVSPLKPVIRVTTPEDDEKEISNHALYAGFAGDGGKYGIQLLSAAEDHHFFLHIYQCVR